MQELHYKKQNEPQRIVAVGLLTERDLSVLGQGFRRAFRVETDDAFQDLLAAIDRADQSFRGAADHRPDEDRS